MAYTIATLVEVGMKRRDMVSYKDADQVEVSFAGAPSWKIGHRAAVLRSRLEDFLEVELNIVGGGYGCFFLQLSAGILTSYDKRNITEKLKSQFISDLASAIGVHSIELVSEKPTDSSIISPQA